MLSSNLLKINMDMTVFTQPQYENLGAWKSNVAATTKKRSFALPCALSRAKSSPSTCPKNSTPPSASKSNWRSRTNSPDKLAENYIQLNDVLIRNITLPTTLEQAIERKLQQEQESLEYEFRLEKAQKEADRLRIEAAGIRDFEEIISKGTQR